MSAAAVAPAPVPRRAFASKLGVHPQMIVRYASTLRDESRPGFIASRRAGAQRDRGSLSCLKGVSSVHH